MTPVACRRFYAALRSANPDPRTELEFGSTYQLLVAVVLSAQATDRSVNAATRALFAAAPTPAAGGAFRLAGLKRHIRTIGLHNAKARHIMATSAALLERHGGEVPADRAALEALPGVGRKTANVVLNVAFGQPTIAVDTHIFRVANRTGLAPGRTPRAVEAGLEAATPREFLPHAHHWLILLGRYTCKARRPLCPRCPVLRWCATRRRPRHDHVRRPWPVAPWLARGSGQRQRAGLPLEPLQAQIVDVIALHPEYHALLEGDAAAPALGGGKVENPYLHLSPQTSALREQVGTNRPAGIADVRRRRSGRRARCTRPSTA
ncbi:MAG: endonuclease III [Steroidobacteraceae bacterium]